MRSGKWWALVVPWTLAVLLVCLTPVSGTSPGAPRFCIFCGEWAARNLLLNVLLFLPLGFGLRRTWGNLAAVVATGFALSFGLEMAQFFVPGRFPALGDVLANTLGAWAGGALGGASRSWIFPSPTAQARLRWTWSLGTTGLILLSGILLSPSTPDSVFYGNWTPEVGGRAGYPGRILSAHLGSYPLPSERLGNPDRVMAGLETKEPLTLEFLAGPSPDWRAPLFRLIGEGQREVIRIDVEGTDVFVRPRYLATRLRLSRPELRFGGALAGRTPDDTVSLTVRADAAGGVQLRIEEGPPVVMALRPGQEWVVFSNVDGLPAPLARIADVLWALALFFPIGWWAPRLPALVGAGLPVFSAIMVVPSFTPLASAPVAHLAAAVLFALAGYLLSRRMTGRSRSPDGRGP